MRTRSLTVSSMVEFSSFLHLLSSMQELIQRYKNTCGEYQVEDGEASQTQVSLGSFTPYTRHNGSVAHN